MPVGCQGKGSDEQLGIQVGYSWFTAAKIVVTGATTAISTSSELRWGSLIEG